MRGQHVRVRAYGQEILDRILVDTRGLTVVTCRPDEYDAAQREGREPVVVGFPLSDVVWREGDPPLA